MIFHSLQFVIFFGIVITVYLSLPHKLQNRALLVASYIFYGSWDWRFLSLLLITTTTDYLCGRKIHESSSKTVRKRYVAISLVVNLGILGAFKYFNFFVDNFVAFFQLFGIDISGPSIHIILPVGISFYTFQSLSYILDIYRKQVKPTDSFLDYALYVSFFPQLVAGPIERAKHLLPQVLNPRQFSAEQLQQGTVLILLGIFKKVFIADNLGAIVDPIFDPAASPSSAAILIGGYAFLFQVYCDFSAYTDIARGTSRLMGFDLMENFRAPYLSKNLQTFWNRWHISLTTWIRDYLYYPLAFTRFRKKSIPPYLVTVITFSIMGLWHGAAWGYVLWGFYNGIALSAYGIISRYLPRLKPENSGRLLGYAVAAGSVLLTFHVILIGDIFFRSTSLEQSYYMVNTMLTHNPFTGELLELLPELLFYTFPILIYDVLTRNTPAELLVVKIPAPLAYASLYGMFYLVYFYGTSRPTFIYFQF